MPRSGTGTYTLPALNPVVTGSTVSSTWANNTLNDLATAMTGSVAADGQTPILANIPMNSKKLTGLAAATTSGDALSYGASVGTAGAATTVANVYSGTYTPTLVNTTNVAASTSHNAVWMRVGNVVTVAGGVDIDPTSASSSTVLSISLPIASDIASIYDLSGVAANGTLSAGSLPPAQIWGDAASNTAFLFFQTGSSITNNAWSYTFQYQIL